MLVLRVTMLEGRTTEQKEALMARLSEAAARHLGAPLEEVRLVIHEVSVGHWGVGGKPLIPDAGRRENRAPAGA
ncbi:MAG TPA: 2-hydroxymuconate tautomerase family protein [Symbiobacteriaceae bacterium]